MKPAGLFRCLLLSVVARLAFGQSAGDLTAANLLLDVDLLINVDSGISQGNDLAKLNIVEFFDLECPNSADYAGRTFPLVLEEYVKTGKIRYVALNFPIEKLHPNATKAAEMGVCAAEQGKSWEARDRLLQNPVMLDTAALGMDRGKFQSCLDSGRAAAIVKSSLAEGRRLKIPGTPSFYFGYADPAERSKVHAVKLLIGTQSFDVFKELIGEFLKGP